MYMGVWVSRTLAAARGVQGPWLQPGGFQDLSCSRGSALIMRLTQYVTVSPVYPGPGADIPCLE